MSRMEEAARDVLTWYLAMKSYAHAIASARKKHKAAMDAFCKLNAERAKRAARSKHA